MQFTMFTIHKNELFFIATCWRVVECGDATNVHGSVRVAHKSFATIFAFVVNVRWIEQIFMRIYIVPFIFIADYIAF